jgi:NAD(P)-dependent dehydrogenase (short-subunit alcohol dehydrogenase family)
MTDAPREGVIVTETTIRVPADVYFRERAPWRTGIVKMDCGPTIVAHLHADCEEGGRVRMSFQLDKSGNAVPFARPDARPPNADHDPQWREMTAQPLFRRALVTDGRSALGQEVAAALVAAGASTVHVGIAQAWKPFEGRERLLAMPEVRLVDLDIADERSATELADDIGHRVDILVNTAHHAREGGMLTRRGAASTREEIEQGFLGFVHLAQAFGPVMRARGADGANSAAAWVNVLSVHAQANWPRYGLYSASQAAVLSLSHCLRAELRPGGLRVVNIFAGPLDTEWFQLVPHPRVAPRAIAAAVVKSLQDGTEDVFVGDVAEDVRRRLASNPKAVERELG